jgi:uncharacterized protein (TIGR03084 family)
MDELLADLAAQHAELGGLLDGLDATAWGATSRCPGWSVSDVVLHLAQTDEMALASLQDRLAEHLQDKAAAWAGATSVDGGAGQLVEAERGDPPGVVHDRWRASAAALREALASRDPHDRVTWVAGELAVRTLATTRLSECWIHTHDVAAGLRTDLPVPARIHHIARLAWRTLPYAFAQAGRPAPGPVTFALTSPAGEAWVYGDGTGTVVQGSAFELCEVAGQRRSAADTRLTALGPDGPAVLALVRTFA